MTKHNTNIPPKIVPRIVKFNIIGRGTVNYGSNNLSNGQDLQLNFTIVPGGDPNYYHESATIEFSPSDGYEFSNTILIGDTKEQITPQTVAGVKKYYYTINSNKDALTKDFNISVTFKTAGRFSKTTVVESSVLSQTPEIFNEIIVIENFDDTNSLYKNIDFTHTAGYTDILFKNINSVTMDELFKISQDLYIQEFLEMTRIFIELFPGPDVAIPGFGGGFGGGGGGIANGYSILLNYTGNPEYNLKITNTKEFLKRDQAYVMLHGSDGEDINIFTIIDPNDASITIKTNFFKIPINSDGKIKFNLLKLLSDEVSQAITAGLIKTMQLKIQIGVDSSYSMKYDATVYDKNSNVVLDKSKSKQITSNIKTESNSIIVSLKPYHLSSDIVRNTYNFNYVDVAKEVTLSSPKFETASSYRYLKDSLNSIIQNNDIIINKMESILPFFISQNSTIIKYNINNLVSRGTLTTSNNKEYFGPYFYYYKKQGFYTGKNIDEIGEKLKYSGNFDIESLSQNFDFASIISQEKQNLKNNSSNLKSTFNNMVINLNKKLSYVIGLEKVLYGFYYNFKDLIESNLKYFRNYKEVKKFSVGKYVKMLNFSEIYLGCLTSISEFYISNANSAYLFDDALEINISDQNTIYKEMSMMINSSYPPISKTDKNHLIVKAFSNINNRLLAFLEDFEKIDYKLNPDGYDRMLFVALELDIETLINESYEGVQLLQSKLNMYIINNIYNTSGAGKEKEAIGKYIKGNNSKIALQQIIINLNKLSIVLRELSLIFTMNKFFNIFLDFDIKHSDQKKKDLGVADLAKVYAINIGTNSNILDKKRALSSAATAIPLVVGSSLIDLARRDPWGVGDYQKWKVTAKFFIPPKAKSFALVGNILCNGSGGARSRVSPVWDGKETWSFTTVDFENNWKSGQIIETTINYSWLDDQGVTKTGSYVFSKQVA